MIPPEILDEIIALAEHGSPLEVCGFISKKGDSWRVHPVPNAAEKPEREFVMEPQSQIDAMHEVRDSGAELFGTYHSHPRTPPVPSAKDMQLALYPEMVHLIVSIAGGGAEASMWRIAGRGCEKLLHLREASDMR